MKTLSKFAFSIFMSASMAGVAAAQDTYVSGFAGLGLRSDSSNSGKLTSNFTTGTGTTIPGGTVLPSGTGLSWDTDFNAGYNLGFAFGMSAANRFRTEVEVRYLRNDVDSHSNVRVGGGAIGSEDAGVLITGAGNLGVSVADVVADGRGKSSLWTFMGNAYYDFNAKGRVNPYIGGGLGYATTQVTFKPSGVPVASDRDGGFAYQAIGGMDFGIGKHVRLFGEYRYLGTTAVKTNLSLLPGYLEIDNRFHMVNMGMRVHF